VVDGCRNINNEKLNIFVLFTKYYGEQLKDHTGRAGSKYGTNQKSPQNLDRKLEGKIPLGKLRSRRTHLSTQGVRMCNGLIRFITFSSNGILPKGY
jgi:hypothetical protein